ncbi:MAG: cyclic nucleotide-binding protein [Alphaproteobacteria bacterium]|nr:MAG: cyclic nucleotide-binding protein [Alphaproteobacteria bacterium]
MTYGAKDELTIRERVFEILERGRRGTVSQAFDLFIIALILGNVAASVIGTVAHVQEVWGVHLRRFDNFCVAVFVAEYLLRLWAAPEHPLMAGHGAAYARLRTMIMPMMVVDLVAILPFFIELLVGVDIAAIRVIRIVRFYRLARYVPAIATIGRVLANEWRSLVGSVVVFAGLLLLASVAMYVVEGHLQPDVLGDVPSAMWWAVVTLSTVGYGDVVPATAAGRAIAGLVMVTGILFFALPVGIIATGFHEEIRRRDFIVSFAMVARVPLFARLDAPTIARLAGMLHARRVAAGAVIFSKGDPADGLYFIANGQVEVDVPGRPVRLGEGDFFGEIGLIEHDAVRTATVTAVRSTDLLVLAAPDFRRLMSQSPELDRAVRETAAQRAEENRRIAAATPRGGGS